jgi:hypothetical protein
VPPQLVTSLPVNGVRCLLESGFSWSDFWAGLRAEPVAKATPPQFVLCFGWIPQFWTVSIELQRLILRRLPYRACAGVTLVVLALILAGTRYLKTPCRRFRNSCCGNSSPSRGLPP